MSPAPPYRIRTATPGDNAALIALLRENPIQMETAYYSDRAPDFFRLHSIFDNSRVALAEPLSRDRGQRLLGCLSVLECRGRIGTEIRPFSYLKDMMARSSREARGVAQELARTFFRDLWRTDAVFTLINERNLRARRLLENRLADCGMTALATLEYTEVVPWVRRRIPGGWLAGPPANEGELVEAMNWINSFYQAHALFEPLDLEWLQTRGRRFPGFDHRNFLLLRQGRRLAGAATFYDPAQLASIVIVRLDRRTRRLSRLLRFLHGATGWFFDPPREGEPVRTLQIRHFAYDNPDVARLLLRGLSNLARDQRMHTVSYLVDARAPLPGAGPLASRYRSILYGRLRIREETKARFGDAPAFLDITAS